MQVLTKKQNYFNKKPRNSSCFRVFLSGFICGFWKLSDVQFKRHQNLHAFFLLYFT